jgi:hypothetical protein
MPEFADLGMKRFGVAVGEAGLGDVASAPRAEIMQTSTIAISDGDSKDRDTAQGSGIARLLEFPDQQRRSR